MRLENIELLESGEAAMEGIPSEILGGVHFVSESCASHVLRNEMQAGRVGMEG